MKPIRIAIIGYGKMGRLVEELAVAQGHTIASRIDVGQGDWAAAADVAQKLRPFRMFSSAART